jgi:diguanylate cyclase (GGDEF)-like protein
MSNPWPRLARLKSHAILFIFALIMLAVGGVHYLLISRSTMRIIEHEAVRTAEVATTQAIVSRIVYSEAAVDKLTRDGMGAHAESESHSGMIPLPSQFLKLVAQEANKDNNGLYQYRPLSKWNLEPSQGVKDDFQQWAWKQLERQDQTAPAAAIDWQPVWRFEMLKGVRTLRYMQADPASNMNCVNCHNALEQSAPIAARRLADGVATGKQWRQHQLLGAIETDIPVDKVDTIAAQDASTTLIVGMLTALCGMAAAGWLAWRDVRRQHKVSADFERQAKFDPLTKLGNRYLFNEQASLTLAHARRSGNAMAVMFVDLDHFKQINDTHGHHAGDLVLSEVSQRLVHCLRETDLIIRQGGDEFLVLLSGSGSESDFANIAGKMLEALHPEIDAGTARFTLTASIGISFYPGHGNDLAELIDKADVALYQAKKNGRNNVCMWHAGLGAKHATDADA